MPVREISSTDAAKSSSDHSAQNLVWWQILIKGALNGFDMGGLQRLLHHLGIESQLIAEVIVDSGNVSTGGNTNLANRGRTIASVGEDSSGNIQ